MAPSAQWYGQAATGLIANKWVGQQMGVALMGTSFVPNIDTQQHYSDISASELAAGGGYTVGGQQIAGRDVSWDNVADEYLLLGNDLTWGPGATFTTRYGVIYEMATVDKWLWALLDFGASVVVSNSVFQIDWTAGILGIQAGPPV